MSSLPTAILTGTPVAESSLEADLRALGYDVTLAADADEAAAVVAAAPRAERLAVVDARFVGHRHSLRLALTDPRYPLAAVPGAVSAQPEARAVLARALAGQAAGRPTVPAAAAGGSVAEQQSAAGSLPDRLAAWLEAEGRSVYRPELGSLVATVPREPAEREAARRAVADVDEEQVRLRSAVKSRDGFFTTFCISPYSRYLARWCARRGLTPNQVTCASLLTALVAAGCAATGTRAGFVAAGVLLIVSFVFDCTDGQLARYSLQYSTLGAWLDATFDRAKEYAYYAGLALGAARGGDDVWALALGAMVLQTTRHVVDFAFTEASQDASGTTAPPASSLSARLDRVGWTVWARRMIVLPIGERWALLAVFTAATTPRLTFLVLLVGCALAACYTTAGRVLRSLRARRPRSQPAVRALAALADTGLLGEAVAGAARRLGWKSPSVLAPTLALLGGGLLVATAALAPVGSPWPVAAAGGYVLLSGLATCRPPRGALDWLVPALFRAAEYTLVLVLAARSPVNGALPAAFGLVAAVAYHHYDTVYRIRGGSGAPLRLLVRAIGGQEGRALVVAVAAALWSTDGAGLTPALTVLAVVLALTVLAESVRFWVSAQAPAVHDETGEPA